MAKLEQWKKAVFRPDEWLCASIDAFGTTLIHERRLSADSAAFICLNPLKRGTSRFDSNVSAFRNFVLEFDSISLDEQRKILKDKAVPYTSLTFSGSKSLHALISLSEPLKDELEWRKFMQALLRKVPLADKQVSNPSRFTRLPTHVRKDSNKEQTLLELREPIAVDVLKSYLEEELKAETEAKKMRVVVSSPIEGGGPLNAWTYQFLNHGAPSGQRHRRAMMAAFDMVKCGWTPDEIRVKLEITWPTAAKNEIANIIEYAIQKSTAK